MNTQLVIRYARHAVLLSLTSSVLFHAPVVNAADLTAAGVEVGVKIEGKTTGSGLAAKTDPNGFVKTTFDFHPVRFSSGQYNLVKKKLTDNPPTITDIIHQYGVHTSPAKESHGTSGEANWDFSITNATDKKKLTINWKATATIDPGTINPPKKVKIVSTFTEPFSFSDSDASATFDYESDGFDVSFDLLSNTFFPTEFHTGGFEGGAIASDTFFTASSRIAPGVHSDAGAFFSTAPTESIDLYSLTLSTSDAGIVSAGLSFGASTSDFTLDFRNHLGASFDPTIPADVQLITSHIEGSFVNGQLSSDLSDVFTVGFVPSVALSEYSVGSSGLVSAGSMEVPEPSQAVLFLTGVGTLVAMRRRQSL